MSELAEHLSDKSREVGVAYGTVIVRPHGPLYPQTVACSVYEEQKFLGKSGYDPNVNLSLSETETPSVGLIPYYSPTKHHVIYRKFELPGTRANIIEKIGTLGAGGLVFAGVEMATAVETRFSALAGLASLAVINAARKRYRTKKLHTEFETYKSSLQAIEQKASSPENSVEIAMQAKPLVLAGEQARTYFDRDISVSGVSNVALKAGDILSWAKSHIADNDFDVGVSLWDGAALNIASGDTIIMLGTSLLGLCESYDKYIRRVSSGGVSLTRRYDENYNRLAKELGFEADDSQHITQIGKTTARHQKEVNIIQLPAAAIVEKLLKQDPSPTTLWRQIAPDAVVLRDNFIERAQLLERTAYINRRTQFAGVDNEEDAEERKVIDARLDELLGQYDAVLLGIIGAAVLRSRTHRYEAMRKSLFASMSETSKAEDQFGAIQLFDVAINSLVQNVAPDSEEAIRISDELQKYLSSAMPYIDGTESVYRQFYTGLQTKFPELQLP